MNIANSKNYINIPREDNVFSLLNCYPVAIFDALQAATGNRYADNNDIGLVNLRPIALFSNYKLTTNSRKHLDYISQTHIVCLMYKRIKSTRDSEDLSIGFDRHWNWRQWELTNNKV